MKKIKKNPYDVKDFELKLGLSLLGGSIILTGAKLYDMNKCNSEGEINIIKDYTESTEKEHEIPISKQYYLYI